MNDFFVYFSVHLNSFTLHLGSVVSRDNEQRISLLPYIKASFVAVKSSRLVLTDVGSDPVERTLIRPKLYDLQ